MVVAVLLPAAVPVVVVVARCGVRLVEVVVQLQLETFFRLRVFFDADADDDAGVDAGEVNVVASN